MSCSLTSPVEFQVLLWTQAANYRGLPPWTPTRTVSNQGLQRKPPKAGDSGIHPIFFCVKNLVLPILTLPLAPNTTHYYISTASILHNTITILHNTAINTTEYYLNTSSILHNTTKLECRGRCRPGSEPLTDGQAARLVGVQAPVSPRQPGLKEARGSGRLGADPARTTDSCRPFE